jgi:homoserine dehydrogenase
VGVVGAGVVKILKNRRKALRDRFKKDFFIIIDVSG